MRNDASTVACKGLISRADARILFAISCPAGISKRGEISSGLKFLPDPIRPVCTRTYITAARDPEGDPNFQSFLARQDESSEMINARRRLPKSSLAIDINRNCEVDLILTDLDRRQTRKIQKSIETFVIKVWYPIN